MPKQKSHSGSKKRFWLTSTGKVKRPHGGKNHKAETKKQKEKEKFASEHSRFHDAGIYRQEYDSL